MSMVIQRESLRYRLGDDRLAMQGPQDVPHEIRWLVGSIMALLVVFQAFLRICRVRCANSSEEEIQSERIDLNDRIRRTVAIFGRLIFEKGRECTVRIPGISLLKLDSVIFASGNDMWLR